MVRITLCLTLLFVAVACGASGEPSETPATSGPPEGLAAADSKGSMRTLELAAESLPGDGEVLWLEVHIGPLKKGVRLIVFDAEGNRLGTIAPYGESVRRAGGSHLVAVPEPLQSDLQRSKTLTVHVQAALAEDTVRSPTDVELKDVRLVVVPVSG